MDMLVRRRDQESKQIENNLGTSTTTSSLKQVHAPIDKGGYYGRWFRHKLLDGILVGTPVLVTIQRHRTPSRTKIMKFFSFLGTEDFYTVLFVFFYWLIDARFGRLFGVLLSVGFYITGALKTLLCLPRPPTPPIKPLERAYDWALPSLHSSLGVICPWYCWLYSNVHYELSPFQMGIMCCVIVVWSFGVMLSRLYLGVHSPADIVCGGIVGVLVLSIWMQVDDYVDFYISQRIELQIKMFVGVFVLLLCHPPSDKGNPSYPDTCTVMGVLFGIVIGRSRQRSRTWLSILSLYPNITIWPFIKYTLARLVIGCLVIGAVKMVAKFFLKPLVLQTFKLCGLTTYSGKQYRKDFHISRHYTKQFVLPPITENADIEKKDAASAANDNNNASDVIDPTSSSVANDVQQRDDSGDQAMTSSKQQKPFTSTDAKDDDEKVDDDVIMKPDTSSQQPEGGNKTLLSHLFAAFLPANSSTFKCDWNHDIPINVVVYTLMTYVAIDVLPQIFLYLGC